MNLIEITQGRLGIFTFSINVKDSVMGSEK